MSTHNICFCQAEELLMSIHNICFCRDTRKMVTIDMAAGTIKSIYSPSCRISEALCTQQPGEKVAIYPADDYGNPNPNPNLAG